MAPYLEYLKNPFQFQYSVIIFKEGLPSQGYLIETNNSLDQVLELYESLFNENFVTFDGTMIEVYL